MESFTGKGCDLIYSLLTSEWRMDSREAGGCEEASGRLWQWSRAEGMLAWPWGGLAESGSLRADKVVRASVLQSSSCRLCVPQTGCVTLDKSFSLSDPQVPRGLQYLAHGFWVGI